MKIALTVLATALLAASGIAFQGGGAVAKQAPKVDDAAIIAQQLPSYPMTMCPVSNEPLGGEMGDPINVVHEGRLVRLCCKMCKKQFKKNPAPVIAQIDAAVIKEQSPGYPLTKCPVSGEALGAMGDPISIVHGTRLVKLCCKGCKKPFAKDPAKVMAKVDAAYIEAQTKTYPLTTCAVSGEPLDAMGGPVDVLYGTRLVRLCCKGCKKALAKDPQKVLATIDAAQAAQKKG